jgi:hypothetical protein
MSTTEENAGGRGLLQRLERGGFQAIIGSEFVELADDLEERASETGLAAPLFIAAAVNAVWELFREHNEAGGVRVGFLRKIDGILHATMPKSGEYRNDPARTAQAARGFRDEILREIAEYDSRRSYE